MIAKKKGPEALRETRWGKGSWKEKEKVTDEQRQWSTAPKRLREQVGLSLKARKLAFNEEFGLSVSIPRFRRIYKEERITQQKMTSRLGGLKLPSQAKQIEGIQNLQERVQELQSAGYLLLQSDEALFSVDAYVQKHWSQIGHPICKGSRWSTHKPIVVYGVISAELGVVHWHFGEHSFKAQDICDAL